MRSDRLELTDEMVSDITSCLRGVLANKGKIEHKNANVIDVDYIGGRKIELTYSFDVKRIMVVTPQLLKKIKLTNDVHDTVYYFGDLKN